MQSRALINLLLLLFIAGLVSFIIFTRSHQAEPDKLTQLERDQVESIKMVRDSGTIVLQRSNQQWLMQSPHQVRAHEFRINTLLDFLDIEISKQYPIDSLDLARYGLDKPRAELHFNNTIVKFGKTNPVTSQRYVQVDKHLFLIYEAIYPLISAQPTSFVDLALFAHDETITRITLPKFTISKTDSGSWHSDSSSTFTADQIQQLLQYWQSAQAFAVHRYMPRKQLANIEITLSNNNSIQLQLSDNDPWLILGRPDLDIEYHLDTNYIAKLLQITEQPAIQNP